MGNCLVSCVAKAQGTQEDLFQRFSSGEIEKKFTETYKNATELRYKIGTKVIVLSDIHRGNGDLKTDMSLNSRQAYISALKYYYENEYVIVHNGDIEDTWMHPIEEIMKANKDIYELEKKFYDENRFIKIVGNHDDIWNNNNNVIKYLHPLFKNIIVHQAIRLFIGYDEYFIFHGHQGSYDYGTCLNSFSACCVENCFTSIVSCCNFDKKSYVTPSNNTEISLELDFIADRWTRDNKIKTIMSHTHLPVFSKPTNNLDIKSGIVETDVKIGLDNIQLDSNDGKTINTEEKFVIKTTNGVIKSNKACNRFKEVVNNNYYYNTGCCCINDSSITGIELSYSEYKVKLVAFKNEDIIPQIVAK